MKTKIQVFVFVLLLFSAVFFVACRKTSVISEQTQNSLKEAVHNWYNELSKIPSENYKKNVDAIVSALNYEDGAIVEQRGNATLFLVRRNTPGDLPEYLALNKTDNKIQAMGVYKAKNINQIQNFLKIKKLPVGETLTMNGLDDKPMMKWETTQDNKSLFKMVQSKKAIAILNQPAKYTVSSEGKKANNMPEPDPGCTDWYWVTYDPSSGMIIDMDYLYTTCGSEGGGGGGGDTPNTELSCQKDFEDEINYNTSEASDVTSITTDESYTLTRKRRRKLYSYEKEKLSLEYIFRAYMES